MPVFRTLTYGEKSQLVQGYNHNQDPAISAYPVYVSCTENRQNLYVDFELPNDSREDIMAGDYQIIVGIGKKRLCIYNRNNQKNDQDGIKSAFGQVCLRINENSQNNGEGDVFQVDPSLPKVEITYPVSEKNDQAIRFTVPWHLIGRRPESNEAIDFNAVYTCQNKKLRYVWNHNIFQRRWKNYRDLAGKLKGN